MSWILGLRVSVDFLSATKKKEFWYLIFRFFADLSLDYDL